MPVSDIDTIMSRCIVNWDDDYRQLLPNGTQKVWVLKDYFKKLIPVALQDNRDFPEVREEWYDNRLPLDKRGNGDDYVRAPTNLDYCVHRALIIHHERNRENPIVRKLGSVRNSSAGMRSVNRRSEGLQR